MKNIVLMLILSLLLAFSGQTFAKAEEYEKKDTYIKFIPLFFTGKV